MNIRISSKDLNFIHKMNRFFRSESWVNNVICRTGTMMKSFNFQSKSSRMEQNLKQFQNYILIGHDLQSQFFWII
jgi:hypothetical protein